MRTVLEKNGFTMTDSCNCGGDPQETWQLAVPGSHSIIVQIRLERDFFRVMQHPMVRGKAATIERKLKAVFEERGLSGWVT